MIDMQLYERLLKIVSVISGGSQTKFAKSLGMAQTTFLGYLSATGQSKIRVSFLEQVLNAYPQIRREWLYFGEGEMLHSDEEERITATPAEMRGKLRMHPRYPDDPLGRIEMLVNVPNDPLKLQTVFGADYKELKPFTARYAKARREWAAWRAAGSREEDVPDTELPRIPEEWLDHFWRHYGPSPEWIRYGGGEHDQGVLLEPRPGMAETERLRGRLAALREETDRLRQELAAAHARLGSRKAQNEERTPPDMGGGSRAPLPPDANAMPCGGE